MSAPLAVDREQVRMLYMEVGAAETARRIGLPGGTVRQWANRYGWNEGHAITREVVQGQQTPAKAILAATLPESKRPVIVTHVTGADALAEMMGEMERETRVSLAKAARNLATQAETAELGQAADALQAGKLAALVHRWADDRNSTVNVSIYAAAVPVEELPCIDV